MVTPEVVSFSLRRHLRYAYATQVLAYALLTHSDLLTPGLREVFFKDFPGMSLREIIFSFMWAMQVH